MQGLSLIFLAVGSIPPLPNLHRKYQERKETMDEEKLEACFFIEGTPKGKGRPRFNTVTGRVYTDKATRDYECYVTQKYVAERRKNGEPIKPLTGAVEVVLDIFLDVPCTIDGRHLKKAEREGLWYTGAQYSKPDIDNVIKIILDALNGIAYRDDKQIIRISASKHYASKCAQVGVFVRIYGE